EMPTYEYECEACGHKFERFQSIKAEPVKKCPECGKNKVKRLIGIGAGMIFKGSGFYITDYRDKSYTEKAKAESGGGGATDAAKSSSEGKSDAKPATSDASSKPAETKAAGDSNSSSAPAPKSEPRASKSAKKK
ncbi:MAG TPA: FmdB family zinc ribbon protein, partial [Tepidisphaeraceae bacterium]|nr:FmdB family zinc ribbon protein [Tepidisphaeraceae bacterium]